MNRFAENALMVAVGFLVTFILTSVINWTTLENGTISTGAPLSIKQEWYIPVQVRNFRGKPLPDVQFSIPKTTSIDSIVSSVPVRIEEVPSTSGADETKKLCLSGVEEKTVVDLLLPIPGRDKAKLVSFLNPRSADIVLNPPGDLESPTIRLLKRSLETSIIYSLIFALYLGFVFRSHQRIRKGVDEAKAKLEEQERECRRCKAESAEKAEGAVRIVKRLQILLLARIRDYEKELSFWRDTVRKVIYSMGDDKNAAKEFLLCVTKSLKTYGTLESADEYGFEAVQTVADMIAASETASRCGANNQKDGSNKAIDSDKK